MKIYHGFDENARASEAESKKRLSGGDFIPYFFLRDDGDIARMRIVSSHTAAAMQEEELASHLIGGFFHRVGQSTQSGKTFYASLLCPKDMDEEGNLSGECEYCDQEKPVRRSHNFLVWAWVYYVLHHVQNPDSQKPWPLVQVGAMQMFREDLNKFMVWQDGFYAKQQLETKAQRLGTITDRDYERIRHGGKQAATLRFDLEHLDPSVMEEHIRREARELPSLVDIATREIRTMDGRNPEGEKAAATTTAPATQHTEVRRPSPEPVAAGVAPVDQYVPSDSNFDDLPF